MIRKSVHITNTSNEDIHIDIRHREDAYGAPAVIIVHGFKGFKDWGFFPDLATRLAMAGYVTVTPNFSRNGIGYDFNTFEKLEDFAQNTHSHELNDLQTVIDHIENGKIAKKLIDTERLALLGHSRGGGTAILKAAELGDKIKCVVTWASLDSFFRYSPEQEKQWNEQGFIEIENSRTKQMMRINKTLWEDLNSNKQQYDILKAAENLENPSLFIHGTNDSSVEPAASERLYEACGAYVKRLELIEETGHTFDMVHPPKKETEAFLAACDFTEHWLDNYLNTL